MDFLDKATSGFLHWFKGTVAFLAAGLVVGIPLPFVMPALLVVYALWCVIYLPMRYLFLGYGKMRLRCKNCEAEWRIVECANCQSTRFLANQCMRCGQYFSVRQCDECGVENMIRAKAIM